jgi:diguanylate cyclase (GGDEF)-like protein
VISIKQHIDWSQAELIRSLAGAWRSLLETAGDCCAEVYPQAGEAAKTNLAALAQALDGNPAGEHIAAIREQAEACLRQWSKTTSGYYRQKAAEVKELLLVVAATAETVGEHDRRYSRQIEGLSQRLRQSASLDDISKLKATVLESVTEMKTTVEQMARESEATVARLKAELSSYEKRLLETEQLASVDSLTGLANRRKIEAELEVRVTRGGEFCVLLLDINGFKKVNDEYGHAAGDELLRQFACELRQAVRGTDLAGRWGGDEFVVLFDCDLASGHKCMERIEQWAFGDYTLHCGPKPVKVAVTAAMGLAPWQRGLTAKQVLDRADAAMYARKQETRKR